MQTEIGSDFWDIPIANKKNRLFETATWFISGRAALRAILQQISLDTGLLSIKVALPSFLCQSMIEPFKKENIEYIFYQVEVIDGALKYNFINVEDCNAILVMDYFGFDFPNNIPSFGKIVIRDITHSIFTRTYMDADYCFGSLRKWAGFIGGGFAFKKDGTIIKPSLDMSEYIVLRKKAIDSKREYISNQIKSKQYLELFHESETMLDECKIAICDSSDIENAEQLDIDKIKTTRRANAKYLIDRLNKYCLFKNLGDNDCPLCVPILCENRDKLRKYLISKEIYCPIHWPKPSQILGNLSKIFYEKELSLICDQRYTEKDMKRIVNAVLSFMENEKNA